LLLTMAPIRVAFIGLSASAKTGWAVGGHLPYLTSERGRKQFKIVALLNSSVDAAKKSIQTFELGSDVKAYGTPEDLAKDTDVQLAVAVTRVDVHYDTIKPSVATGKDAFVEWPLAENVKRASELADLAKQKGVRTVVGLQARVSPVLLKIKEVLSSGRIGKVLSSQVSGSSPYVERHRVSEGLAYFLDKKVGGNPVTIGYAHSMFEIWTTLRYTGGMLTDGVIDAVHQVLGEFKTSNSHTQLQRPRQTVYNKETGAEKPATSDVPDLVSVHGSLEGSDYVVEGATLVANYKPGQDASIQFQVRMLTECRADFPRHSCFVCSQSLTISLPCSS
jgi:predicted dehydrogenase